MSLSNLQTVTLLDEQAVKHEIQTIFCQGRRNAMNPAKRNTFVGKQTKSKNKVLQGHSYDTSGTSQ